MKQNTITNHKFAILVLAVVVLGVLTSAYLAGANATTGIMTTASSTFTLAAIALGIATNFVMGRYTTPRTVKATKNA